MKQDIENIIKKNLPERIWIFIAYKEDGLPFFSKLFTNHTEMKEFSANHSSEWKNKCKKYSSTYLDLYDKDLLFPLIADEVLKVVVETKVEIIKKLQEIRREILKNDPHIANQLENIIIELNK